MEIVPGFDKAESEYEDKLHRENEESEEDLLSEEQTFEKWADLHENSLLQDFLEDRPGYLAVKDWTDKERRDFELFCIECWEDDHDR